MLLLWAFLMLANVLFLALTVGFANALGLPVKEVSLGAGPRLLGRSLGGVEVSLRALLWSSFVKFAAEDGLDSVPAGKRLLVTLGPFGVLLAVGLIGGTPPELLPGFITHFFEGAVHPTLVARPLLAAAAELAREQPLHAFFRCCAFLGVLNLLPIPSLAGWQVVQLVVGKRLEKFSIVVMVGFFLLTLSWLVAFASFVGAPG